MMDKKYYCKNLESFLDFVKRHDTEHQFNRMQKLPQQERNKINKEWVFVKQYGNRREYNHVSGRSIGWYILYKPALFDL